MKGHVIELLLLVLLQIQRGDPKLMLDRDGAVIEQIIPPAPRLWGEDSAQRCRAPAADWRILGHSHQSFDLDYLRRAGNRVSSGAINNAGAARLSASDYKAAGACFVEVADAQRGTVHSQYAPNRHCGSRLSMRELTIT